MHFEIHSLFNLRNTKPARIHLINVLEIIRKQILYLNCLNRQIYTAIQAMDLHLSLG